MEIECKKAVSKRNPNVKFDYAKGEIRLFDTRIIITNLIPACEKIDEMFGTGGEVIVDCIGFEAGHQLFEAMIRNSPNQSKEELLNAVVDLEPQMGWGITNLEIVCDDLPKIEVAVRNSPVKALQGSPKHLIGSFWAGVLSKYFNQKLKCASFSYDEKEDRLHCTITT